MESPSRSLMTLTPSSSLSPRPRHPATDSNSPEFEFWRIPSGAFPHSPLHSADELFSHGFLLPLHHLKPDPIPDPDPDPVHEPGPEEPEELISAAITSGNPILTASKRWKEIFKKKPTVNSDEGTVKTEKPEKKRGKNNRNTGNVANGNNNSNNGSGNSGLGSSSAELNINLWPFSRSRSAGTNSARSKPVQANRKVSSAPCSRSNSSGESKSSRKSWPSSPGRTGVHIGRSSPVVQLRRTRAVADDSRQKKNDDSQSALSRGVWGDLDDGRRKLRNNSAGKGRVLNLNVPMCIGYRQQLSCRSDEDSGGGGGGSGGSGSNGNLFSLRGLFSKKSVLTT